MFSLIAYSHVLDPEGSGTEWIREAASHFFEGYLVLSHSAWWWCCLTLHAFLAAVLCSQL